MARGPEGEDDKEPVSIEEVLAQLQAGEEHALFTVEEARRNFNNRLITAGQLANAERAYAKEMSKIKEVRSSLRHN